MVFLHGAGGLFWDPLPGRLAAEPPVIAPEHPGSGESQGLEHLEDLWDLVLYYDELFDALGLSSGRRWSATPSAAWWPPSWPPTTPSG